MPRVSKEDLLKKANAVIGENATEEGLSLLEDIADTIEDTSDIEAKEKEIEELKAKIVETEKTWSERYRSRFTDHTPSTEPQTVQAEVDNGANEDDIEPPSFEEIGGIIAEF